MALTQQQPANIPLDVFPDGLKTTGQHPPLYEHIHPFDKFPKEITGPTVWKPEDYSNSPEKWTHRFTEEEIEELSAAADGFLEAKIPMTGISKVSHLFTTIVGSSVVSGECVDDDGRATSPSLT